jgi:putative oxidoreductase
MTDNRTLVLSFWLIEKLNQLGTFLPQLGLRLLLAWEFWEAGLTKYQGENWFQPIRENFPFPFNIIPVEMSWFIATWFELIGAIALLIGLGTRFFTVSLMILTITAMATVHLPSEWTNLTHLFTTGYDVCDSEGGNFKIPLIYLVLFLPLLFNGPGKASFDHLIQLFLTRPNPKDIHK